MNRILKFLWSACALSSFISLFESDSFEVISREALENHVNKMYD